MQGGPDEGNVNDAWASSDIGDPHGESPASATDVSIYNIWASPFTLPSTVVKEMRTEQRNWSSLADRSSPSSSSELTR